MDFIKETLSRNKEKRSGNINPEEVKGSAFLNDNIEGLMLSLNTQMNLAMKMMGVITNGSMLEKFGVRQLRDGFKWTDDFPISKAMMQALTLELLENAKELMRIVLEELDDGYPEIRSYEVAEMMEKISDSVDELDKSFGGLLDAIKKKQEGALKEISTTQDPN